MEAELLLGCALALSRLEVVRGLSTPPTPEQWRRFDTLLARRSNREPLAYLRGTQEFYGLELGVSPAVLVPRPETEMLVDLALERLRERPHPTVIDVGSGSGCIAVAMAKNAPAARVTGIDLSRDALAVAAENARRHGVGSRVLFLQADLLAAVRDASLDMVLSNPPYIPSNDIPGLQPEVAEHEPRIALDGGPDGLAVVRRITAQAARVLRPGGWLAVEVGQGQAEQVGNLFVAAGFECMDIRSDLAGIQRVIAGKRGS